VADSSRRVVLATRNAGKIAELSRILAGVGNKGGGGVQIVGLESFPDAPDVPETGSTFADNALLKARAIAQYTGLPAVSDDSGLAVDALHGMPGVLSARWAGKHGDDQANLDLLLGQLADVAERGAVFVCVAALVVPLADTTQREWTATGVLAGALARAPRGANGFGYDPIFVPYGLHTTTAELEPDAKDAISHRGRAFRAIAPLIAANALPAEAGQDEPRPDSAPLGSGLVWPAVGTAMLTGWLRVSMVTVMVSVRSVPSSLMTAFRMVCEPSIQTVNVAVVRPAAVISFCTCALTLPLRYPIPLSRESVPVYSVTATPSMVPVPTLRTLVAPSSICDSLSGLLLVAWLKSWLKLIPVPLLSDESGIPSHGLVRCSSWVRNDHFM